MPSWSGRLTSITTTSGCWRATSVRPKRALCAVAATVKPGSKARRRLRLAAVRWLSSTMTTRIDSGSSPWLSDRFDRLLSPREVPALVGRCRAHAVRGGGVLAGRVGLGVLGLVVLVRAERVGQSGVGLQPAQELPVALGHDQRQAAGHAAGLGSRGLPPVVSCPVAAPTLSTWTLVNTVLVTVRFCTCWP